MIDLVIVCATFIIVFAAAIVVADYLEFIHKDRFVRVSLVIVCLGLFSATYTYTGGLGAVVRMDIIQFVILLSGGLVVIARSDSHPISLIQLFNSH